MTRNTSIGVLVAALTTVAIAGCATAAPTAASAPGAAATAAPSAPSAATAAHNDADVTFVQGMIPHHTQAVAMAQLADGRASSPGVIALAEQIEQAQGPEIAQMQGFLQSWNVAAAPSGDMGGMAGMGGMSGMSGMMTDQQMKELDSASGAAFDRMFLQMMTDHHAGAITMAQTELKDGQSAEVKALAQKIIDAQQSEITTMKQLLTTV